MTVPRPDIPLPASWPEHAKSAVLFAISLSHYALAVARGWCANSLIARVRLAADNDRLTAEVALLREELRIKDARMARIPARERPHYPPPERLTILQKRIAQTLARAGLHLAVTTVSRIRAHEPSPEPAPAPKPQANPESTRTVTAKYPGHVFTTVPTNAGFWVPWLPFALAQRWPFRWWVAVVMDHSSRAVVGFAVFGSQPSALQVCALLDRAVGGLCPEVDGACAGPQVAARVRPGAVLRLVVSRLDGVEHLPLEEIKRAA